MRIRDFSSEQVVKAAEEFETILQHRFDEGANSFWLYPADEDVPSLLILAMNDLASLHFFPNQEHPGFSSIGDIEGLDPNGTTVFYMDGMNAPQDMNNDTIVPFEKAVEAAKEFFVNGELPNCIEWREL